MTVTYLDGFIELTQTKISTDKSLHTTTLSGKTILLTSNVPPATSLTNNNPQSAYTAIHATTHDHDKI